MNTEMHTEQLQSIIDSAWENRANITAAVAPKEVREAVEHVLAELDAGRLRVATREGVGQWTVHQWIKKAVLLSFRLRDNALMQAGDLTFFDKVPTKFGGMSEAELQAVLDHGKANSGDAGAQVDHFAAVVDELAKANPAAASYAPGAIL